MVKLRGYLALHRYKTVPTANQYALTPVLGRFKGNIEITGDGMMDRGNQRKAELLQRLAQRSDRGEFAAQAAAHEELALFERRDGEELRVHVERCLVVEVKCRLAAAGVRQRG